MINRLLEFNERRNTLYNNTVMIGEDGVNTLARTISSIFGDIYTYRESIASIKLFPIKNIYDTSTYTLNIVGGLDNPVELIGCKPIQNISYYYMGQYLLHGKFYNFADYKGYTQIKAFLPFIGYVDIDVNECMGETLQFRLVVDYSSGKGMYIIGVTGFPLGYQDGTVYADAIKDANIRIIGVYECQVGTDIPLGSANAGDIIRNLALGTVKTAVAVGASVYTGNLAPAVSTISTTSTKTYDVKGKSLQKGSKSKQIKSGTVTTETTSTKTTEKPFNKSRPISEAINGSIDTLNSLHSSGNSDRVNDSSLMAQCSQYIHIIRYTPRFDDQSSDYNEDFGHLFGYPLGRVVVLGDLSGYTEITDIHIEGEGFSTATKAEMQILEQQLTSGIILPSRT